MKDFEDILKKYENTCEASANVCQIVSIYKEDYEKLRDDYGYTEFDTEEIQKSMDIITACHGRQESGITLLRAMGCLKPESVCYGVAVGFFVYKDFRVFRFHYNIHTPEFKGPRISNSMDNIEEIVIHEKMRDKYGISACDFKETSFGNQAFWYHTPNNTLDEEAMSLRALIMSFQAYCRKRDYCKLLGKLDKKHLAWERDLKLRLNSDTGVHPALKQMKDGRLAE